MSKIRKSIQDYKEIQLRASKISPTGKNVRSLKKDSRLKKQNMRVILREGDKEKLAKMKKSLKFEKRVLRTVKRRHKKTKLTVTKRSISKIRQSADKMAHQDDTFSEYVSQKQKANQRSQIYRSLKKTTKSSVKITGKAIKGSYGIGNRSYNFMKGNGFKNLPNPQMQRLQQIRKQLLRVRQHKLTRGVTSVGRFFGKGVGVANTPFKVLHWVKLGFILLPIMLLLVLFTTVSINRPAILQTEQELTKSYLQFTKLDAENSDTLNLFFTNWDDSLFYFNYRYTDFLAEDGLLRDSYKQEETEFTFDELSRKWWTDLNGSRGDYRLKSMETLAKDKDSYWFLGKEYSSFQKIKKKAGFTTLAGQLENFLKEDTLQISKRFGYERVSDEIKLNRMTQVLVKGNTEITSPMNGTVVELGWNRVVIERKNSARFTFVGVKAPRLTEGTEVFKGDYIGEAESTSLTISYQKFSDGEWFDVNPAFYFPKVDYTQLTLLASTKFSPSGELKERATYLYDKFSKLGYTVEGISAILGNFEVESQVNPKRAEGDYLLPPIGASSTSWDDEGWLNYSGPIIYAGQYPNILKRGLGLGQWTDTADGSRRQTMLRDYAKSQAKKWYEMELQLDFMLNGDIPSAQNILKGILGRTLGSTVPDLTVTFLNRWEGNPGDKVAERIGAAQNWYQYFTRATVPLSSDSKAIYEQYKDKMLMPYTDKEVKEGQGWAGNAYALGNCTWYVYNRMKQLGKDIYAYMGNANQWVYNYTMTPGATLASTPQAGDMVVFERGVYGSHPTYGHVAIVEAVLEDGSFIISEMNVQGIYSMGYRHLQPANGLTFIHVN